MADVHTKEQRSFNMSRIRGRDTKPEMLVRRFLHANGFRYKLHDKTLPGKPDIVLPKYKTVIFVHGCFWHQHDCPRGARRPKGNAEYWTRKLTRNVERDGQKQDQLTELGWQVLIVWECETKNQALLQSRLVAFLKPKAADSSPLDRRRL